MILTPADRGDLTPGGAALAVFTCPSCRSAAGWRCVTATGRRAALHLQRRRLGEGYVKGWADAKAEVDALTLERDNLVVALDAADAAREDAYQDAAGWAVLTDRASTYQAELKATIVALRADAARDATTIARLRREVAAAKP